MFACPHCKEPGIHAWEKYWASTANPVVCRHCGKPSSIPGTVETASVIFYANAAFAGIGVIAVGLMRQMRDLPFSGPTPGMVLLGLAVTYGAVEAAKVRWSPLKALSHREVKNRRTFSNTLALAGLAIIICALLFERLGH